jgi:hypothetical protein
MGIASQEAADRMLAIEPPPLPAMRLDLPAVVDEDLRAGLDGGSPAVQLTITDFEPIFEDSLAELARLLNGA